MRKFLIIIFMAVAVAAHALVIRTESPGQLPSLVGNPGYITELSVSGPVDVSDLDFIAGEMPELHTLDLSEVIIEAYTGKRVAGFTAWPASYFPGRIFAGSSIRSVSMPTVKVSLGEAIFASSAIETFKLPAAYTEISAGMFAGCKSLRTVEFTAPVSIGDHVFTGCTGLAEVKGSQFVKSVGARAFAGCTALKKFAVGSGLVHIGDEAFEGAGLVNIDLTPAAGLVSIGEWSFASMASLVDADLGYCERIGRGVLWGCTALKSAVYMAGDVPDYAFAGNKIQDGAIASGTRSLGRYAMSGMSGVADIILPGSLEYIGENAMEYMTGLKNITASGDIVPALGENVWHGVNQPAVNLYVAHDIADEYKNARQWQNFNIVSDSGNEDSEADIAMSMIRARFAGDVLQLRSTGADIDRLCIYDPSGSCIATINPKADNVDIDCSAHITRLYIIHARLADGTEAAIKLAR